MMELCNHTCNLCTVQGDLVLFKASVRDVVIRNPLDKNLKCSKPINGGAAHCKCPLPDACRLQRDAKAGQNIAQSQAFLATALAMVINPADCCFLATPFRSLGLLDSQSAQQETGARMGSAQQGQGNRTPPNRPCTNMLIFQRTVSRCRTKAQPLIIDL